MKQYQALLNGDARTNLVFSAVDKNEAWNEAKAWLKPQKEKWKAGYDEASDRTSPLVIAFAKVFDKRKQAAKSLDEGRTARKRRRINRVLVRYQDQAWERLTKTFPKYPKAPFVELYEVKGHLIPEGENQPFGHWSTRWYIGG